MRCNMYWHETQEPGDPPPSPEPPPDGDQPTDKSWFDGHKAI